MLKLCHNIASYRTQDFLEVIFMLLFFFSIRNEVFSGEQEKQSIFVREGDRII